MTTVKNSIVINVTRAQFRSFIHDPESVMARDANICHYQPDDNWPAVGAKLEAKLMTFFTRYVDIGGLDET
jgi:hypothetical protein